MGKEIIEGWEEIGYGYFYENDQSIKFVNSNCCFNIFINKTNGNVRKTDLDYKDFPIFEKEKVMIDKTLKELGLNCSNNEQEYKKVI